MTTIYLPSEEDRAALQEMVAEWRGRTRGTTRRTPFRHEEEGESSEVYVARVPSGGIAGMDENTTGTSGVDSYLYDDQPAYTDCELYRLSGPLTSARTMLPVGRSKRVYNLSVNAVEGDQWILVAKDKFGDWYATHPADSTVGGASTSSAGGVSFVRVTSSTPATGNLYPGVLQSYSVAGGYVDTATSVRVQFPNDEVPGLARVAAVDSGGTSGGLPVYQSLERPLTVAATDAGTGDSNAAYYGISTLNVNQGTGLALTNSSLSCKVAAQSASATHSGVIDLVDGQVLGSGGKRFNSYLLIDSYCYVNNDSEAVGTSFLVKSVTTGGVTPFIISSGGLPAPNLPAARDKVTVGDLAASVVRPVNDVSPMYVGGPYGMVTQYTGSYFNMLSTPGVYAKNSTSGFTGQYIDGTNTRLTIQGGIITGVF